MQAWQMLEVPVLQVHGSKPCLYSAREATKALDLPLFRAEASTNEQGVGKTLSGEPSIQTTMFSMYLS